MDLSWQKPAIPSGVCCSKAPTTKFAALFARRRVAYSSTEMARSSSGDSTKDHGSVSSASMRKFQSVWASSSVNNRISTGLLSTVMQREYQRVGNLTSLSQKQETLPQRLVKFTDC